MKSYQVILFDLDGTLTQSHLGITKSFQYALNKMGINESNPNNLIKYVGPPFQDTLTEFYGFKQHEVERAVNYYRERYSKEGMYENQLYAQIPVLLETLKREKKTLVVATAKLTEFAERILKHFQIDQYFDLIVGSTLDGSRISKTDVIQHALSQFTTLKKENFIMIGDRKHDIIGAQNAGIDSIALTYGYGNYEELKSAKPTYIVNNVKEIEEILLVHVQ
ncbi:HAD family hydrolase [Priestia megaterium]